MAKFNVGDKVVVRDDKELLVKSNLAQQLASLLCGFGIDEIEAGATGVIASVKNNNIYAVDFGETYKGVKADGTENGTCAAITEELLELVSCETCESCNDCKGEFKPYLSLIDDNEFMGYIGESTNLKTSKGNPLCIGDIVLVGDSMTVVVKDEDGAFFMGYKPMLCFGMPDSLKVVKKISYKHVEDDDIVTCVKYVRYE